MHAPLRHATSFAEIVRNFADQLDLRDFMHFTPVGLAETFWSFVKKSDAGAVATDGLTQRDEELLRAFFDLSRYVGKHYFRLKVFGVENVPARGSALLVGSHNGGLLTSDSIFTVQAIWDHFGAHRIVHPLTHDVVMHDRVLRKWATRLGVLRAAHDTGDRALKAGHIVLVYPGSDVDTFRPFSQRHKIELGGRKGFVRLALRNRTPVVPVVSVGTHEQLIVLTSGKTIARALGLKRLFRAEVFPITLSLPWGIASGILPYIPLPAQTSVAFGPKLEWPEFGPGDAQDDRVVTRCYGEVHDAMQSLLDSLSAGRTPFFG